MKSTLDELLQRVNILDVISQYVKLRRTGKNFVGLCPFHKEKTPSFSVSIEKQIYYCFGCHEGGNVINFLMKYERLSFQETLENLASQYGVEINRKESTRRTNSFDALLKLTDYYHSNLKNSKFALQYLEKRGIDRGIIDEFKIGFSDGQGYNMKVFLKDAGIPNDVLLATGILRIKDGDIYDIFRGRVVIPIFDVNKKVIGFGGRTIEKDGFPKYINSPESPIFSKRLSLFGIDKTKKYITEKDEAFIVEGYFDFISLYTSGLKNVVSTLGTSVTEEQLSKLRNYTENITLMLDGDEAGIKSALRLIELFSELDINGNMVVLPEGHDPDSFVRKEGIEGVNQIINKKKPILDYFFDYHMDRCGVEKLEGKLVFVRTVMPYIDGIRNGVKKRLYIKRLSELTNVEEHHFWDNVHERKIEPSFIGDDSKNIIGRKVIGVLMSNPDLLENFKRRGVIRYVQDKDIQEVLSIMFNYVEEKKHLEINSFISVLEKEHLKDLVLKSVFDLAECDESEYERVLLDYFKHIERKSIKEEAKKITKRLSEAEKRGDEREIMELLQEKRQVLAFIKSNFIK
ncbi:MAG: DNA primase [Proteobacteria bacterium]|nr:DNA primase [Pseudomonadota bacterium]